MDGLRYDARNQPGLEVVPPNSPLLPYPPKQDLTPYQPQTKVDAPYIESQETPESSSTSSSSSQICGLTKRAFWIVLAVLLIVIAGAVGGGVGGSLASKSSSSSSKDESVTRPSSVGTGQVTSSMPLLSVTTTSSSTVATPTPTPSGDVIEPRVYRMTNLDSGTAIDLFQGDTRNGSAVVCWALDMTQTPEQYTHQAWQVSLVSKGIVNIVNQEANSYITAPRALSANSDPTDDSNKASVFGRTPGSASDPYSQWKVTRYSDDTVSFQSVAYPSKVLDLSFSSTQNGAPLLVWTAEEGKKNQRWKLLPS